MLTLHRVQWKPVAVVLTSPSASMMINYKNVAKTKEWPEFKARQRGPVLGQTVPMQPSNLPPALCPRLPRSVPEIGPGTSSV